MKNTKIPHTLKKRNYMENIKDKIKDITKNGQKNVLKMHRLICTRRPITVRGPQNLKYSLIPNLVKLFSKLF